MTDAHRRCRRRGPTVTGRLVATSLRHCPPCPSGGGVCPEQGALAPSEVVEGG